MLVKLDKVDGKTIWINPLHIVDMEECKNTTNGKHTIISANKGSGYVYYSVKETPEVINRSIQNIVRNILL